MKREKLNNIFMAVAIVLIFAYIFYEVYSVSHIDIKTETAVVSTVYEKIDAKAIVRRDEKPINKVSGKITVPCFNDGDKVNVGGNIAMTFSSEKAATDYSKYAELQNQLAYYRNLESRTLGQAASVESIDSEINNNVNLYIRALNSSGQSAVSRRGISLTISSFAARLLSAGRSICLQLFSSLPLRRKNIPPRQSPKAMLQPMFRACSQAIRTALKGFLIMKTQRSLPPSRLKTRLPRLKRIKRTPITSASLLQATSGI